MSEEGLPGPQEVYDRSPDRWHLDKRVRVTEMLTLASLCIAGALAYGDLDNRSRDNRADIVELREDRQREREADARDRRADQVVYQRLIVDVAQMQTMMQERFTAMAALIDQLRLDLRTFNEGKPRQ